MAGHRKSIFRCSRRRICLAAGLCLMPIAAVRAGHVEMSPVTVQDTFVTPAWTTVTFIQAFPTTPVVLVLATNNGGDPMSLRVRNITPTGFQVLQTEPSANDGVHLQNDTAYLAAEPGTYTLPDGSRMHVLNHNTTSFANRLIATTWDTVFFPSAFSGTPAVVAQIQTLANEANTLPGNSSVPFMDVGIQAVGTSSMQVTLERGESTNGTVTSQERIGIVALENARNFSFTDVLGTTVQLQSLLTPTNVQGYDNGCFSNGYPATFPGTPLSVASANTRAGNNGGWVRRCSEASGSIGLTIDEDLDTDAERGHIGESAGVIAASTAFHVNFDVDLLVSKNVASQNDPFNGATNPKSIPNADIEYVIEIENRGSVSPDLDTLVITDDVPAELRLCVTTVCLAGGPVILDISGSPVAPGITLGPVAYSNNGGATYTYVPVPDTDGFDNAVDAIQITMTGVLASIAPTGAPSFELILAARVN